MNNKTGWVVSVVAGVMMFQCGCRTTCLEAYAPRLAVPYQASDKILGLPPVAGGVPLDGATRQKVEAEIDKALSRQWKGRYVPVAQGRQSGEALVAKWMTQMDCDYDLAARLRVNSALCQDLSSATGCRYAMLPSIGRCKSDAANILNLMYVLPAGMVIIVGNVPVFLGKYQADDVSVCTATLIDLKEARVMSDSAMAARGQTENADSVYPAALLNSIGRSARVKQEKK